MMLQHWYVTDFEFFFLGFQDVAKIWIINQYASTPATGQGRRHHHFARLLAKQGHSVCVIAARMHHLLLRPDLAQEAPQIEEVDGYRFVRLDTPSYRNVHGAKRAIGWMSFAWQLQSLDRLIGEKPDSVCISSPSLVSFLGAERLARRVGARLVFEARDLWPSTLVELGRIPQNHPLISLLQWIEGRAYSNADAVVSTLSNAYEHMKDRGLSSDRFTWIPNGVTPHEIGSEELDAAVSGSIPKDKFVIGYTGAFGLANSLDTILDAARILKDKPEFHFVLIGSGSRKSALIADARSIELNNITFCGPIPTSQVQSAIRYFDACAICWEDNPIYRYGTSANKMGDYMLGAKPIIQSYSGAGDIVAKEGLGYTVPAKRGCKLAEAVILLGDQSNELRFEMGRRGKVLATTDYNYNNLVRSFEAVLGV